MGLQGQIVSQMKKINSFIDGKISKEEIGLSGDNRSESELRDKLKKQIRNICLSCDENPRNGDLYKILDGDAPCANPFIENHGVHCSALSLDFRKEIFLIHIEI